ncbi:FecR family protein [Panacagrimonas perspica]|uniref:FecR family protein n=1 Tax=Panacagrimonas perspica TaxID=381431 RepID=A0A4R7NY28_9GAMM|nr:FecR domain-containing protein [Panacagrimonas perspica]TDU25621.1 FecR family protein [Panacagrimonas perspica]THD03785.1 hypothetical protein B1810_07865 [Panacagrimonas perspica]
MSGRGSAMVDPDVLAKASVWTARLWADDVTEQDRAACRAWCEAHPDHARAWSIVHDVGQQISALSKAGARATLLDRRVSDPVRRRALKALGALLTVGLGGHAVSRTGPWQRRVADHATRIGEIRALSLPDGGRVVLDSATALDIVYTGDERRLRLRTGRISVVTAPDPMAPARAFCVETVHGTALALGTEFSVHHLDNSTEVVVQHGKVELRPQHAVSAAVRLIAGQRAGFTQEHVDDIRTAAPGAEVWTRGLLVANDLRLSEFVTTVSRYRVGVLRCDERVEELRVTGVFPLQDTDRALANLTLGIPVDIAYRSSWWVTVVPRPSAGT